MNKIIGEWTISKSKSISTNKSGKLTESEVVCNVCPKVEFTTEHKAIIKDLNGKGEIYIWKITDNKISFEYLGNKRNGNRTFYEDYSLEFIPKNNFLELELTHSSNTVFLSLRR